MKKSRFDEFSSISDVRDNGRRGAPLRGCDCTQCFGYCNVDRELAKNERSLYGPVVNEDSDEAVAKRVMAKYFRSNQSE